MDVEVEVSRCKTTGNAGRGVVDGVRVICSRCDHEVQVQGTSSKSVRRACAQMRDECPNREGNFYFDPSGSDQADS